MYCTAKAHRGSAGGNLRFVLYTLAGLDDRIGKTLHKRIDDVVFFGLAESISQLAYNFKIA